MVGDDFIASFAENSERSADRRHSGRKSHATLSTLGDSKTVLEHSSRRLIQTIVNINRDTRSRSGLFASELLEPHGAAMAALESKGRRRGHGWNDMMIVIPFFRAKLTMNQLGAKTVFFAVHERKIPRYRINLCVLSPCTAAVFASKSFLNLVPLGFRSAISHPTQRNYNLPSP